MFKPKCFKEVKFAKKDNYKNKCNGEIDNATLGDCGWGKDTEIVQPQFESKCQKCKYLYKE